MKTRKITVILSAICVFTLVLGFAACKSDDTTSPPDEPKSQTLSVSAWGNFIGGSSPKLTIDTILTSGEYPVSAGTTLNTGGKTLTVNNGAKLIFDQGAKYTGDGNIVIQPGGALYDRDPEMKGVWTTGATGSIVIKYGATAYTGNVTVPVIGSNSTGITPPPPSMVLLKPNSSLTLIKNGYVVSGSVEITAGNYSPPLLTSPLTLKGVNGARVIIPPRMRLGYWKADHAPPDWTNIGNLSEFVPGLKDINETGGTVDILEANDYFFPILVPYSYIDAGTTGKILEWTGTTESGNWSI
jgi:hypothetical protein